MASEQLDGGAVREIERLTGEALGKTVEIDGREYATREVFDPRRPEPIPKTLIFRTLQSFADYVNSPVDAVYANNRGERFVHVEEPTAVDLVTEVFGEFNQRAVLATARAMLPGFDFGTFMDPETFNVAVRTCFEPTDDRAAVLRLTGNLVTEAVQTIADDGISQQATARRGIVKVEKVEVPTPVVLKPYRTFIEVDQPESPFLLRLRGGGDGRLPSCALFPCDGDAWRLPAVKAVREWLKAEIEIPVFA